MSLNRRQWNDIYVLKENKCSLTTLYPPKYSLKDERNMLQNFLNERLNCQKTIKKATLQKKENFPKQKKKCKRK